MIEPLMVSEMGIGAGMGADVVELVSHAGLVVKMVLMILLFFSIVSWAIIVVKFRVFRAAEKESRSFLDLFWGTRNFSKAYAEAKRLAHSPIATMFKAGFADVEKIRKDLLPAGNPLPQANGEGQRRLAEELASIDRTLKRVASNEITRLERALTFLATTGNATPFIGLFGTVWGIMDAFRQIGFRGSTSLAIVAPGISEALIATAAGLFAAIPAVVAYNYYLNKMRVVAAQMESFSAEFLNIVERHLKGL